MVKQVRQDPASSRKSPIRKRPAPLTVNERRTAYRSGGASISPGKSGPAAGKRDAANASGQRGRARLREPVLEADFERDLKKALAILQKHLPEALRLVEELASAHRRQLEANRDPAHEAKYDVAVQKAQEIVRRRIPEGRSLVDELIAEREALARIERGASGG